jgi:predicted RNase H-like HicB family nuclease
VEIDVVIHRDSETDSYWAESPQLPGCHAVGKTLEELYESLREAVELYVENGEHPDLLLSDRIHAIERYEIDQEGLMYPADLGSDLSRKLERASTPRNKHG